MPSKKRLFVCQKAKLEDPHQVSAESKLYFDDIPSSFWHEDGKIHQVKANNVRRFEQKPRLNVIYKKENKEQPFLFTHSKKKILVL